MSREKHEIKLTISAIGDSSDFDAMLKNLNDQYGEFIIDDDMTEVIENDEGDGYIYTICGTWFGSMLEAKRLEHHAEGLYEGIGLEYVHVEVDELK